MPDTLIAPTFVYVGTFTRMEPHARGNAEGIYVYRWDPSTGALSHVQTVSDVPNPSYLALSPDRRHLYSVNAVPEIDGHPGGAVSAFAIDQDTGRLTFLNRQSTGGAGPAYVSVDRTGRYVMAANYGGGSVAVLPVRDGGVLGEMTDFVQHEGSSVHPTRQEGPHAHSIMPDPSNRFVLAADLGVDKVYVYRLDLTRGKLVPNDLPWARLRPGAGPRHLSFHPNERYLYVINELNSTITAFVYDAQRGTLEEIHSVSTLPDGFSGENTCADVHVAPSGRFVYGSNRGHDSIAIFAIDEQTGRLTPIGHESTRGRTPRNFAFDPTGTRLYAANQDTNNVVVFSVDEASGKLMPTGDEAKVLTPVCLKFLSLPAGSGARHG